ncbi:MAG: hypothetical protein R3B93_16460 [Bacteroidia bacterium]
MRRFEKRRNEFEKRRNNLDTGILLNDGLFIEAIIELHIRENEKICFHCAVFQSGAKGRLHTKTAIL